MDEDSEDSVTVLEDSLLAAFDFGRILLSISTSLRWVSCLECQKKVDVLQMKME